MNKKPVLLRSLFALLVLGVFIFSMFPFGRRNFFKTVSSMSENPGAPELQKVIAHAQSIAEKDKSVYPSVALETAAGEIESEIAQATGKYDKNGKLLLDFVKPVIKKNQKMANNKDVIAYARKLSAGAIRLGIDLNGGVEFLLELIPEASGADKDKKLKNIDENFDHYRDIAIENLRRRIEGLSIFESEITPAGGRYISLRVPTNSRDEKVKLKNLISMSARLNFNLVHKDNARLVEEYLKDPKHFKVPHGYMLMESVESDGPRGSRTYIVERDPRMDGKGIVNAFVNMTQYGQREIILNFNSEGAVQFGDITTANVGRQLAIILDGKLYSAPNIIQPITGGNAQITGSFSREDADNIANALVSGSVPFKVDVKAEYDIAPTIGKETVRDGMWSGILGTILVMIFMLIYYRRSGLVADISLLLNALMMVGAVAAFSITLTLPGIAGIILTIGMAVDANVLFYERIREEIANGKTVSSAIDAGFSKAFSAIFDSNITTLLTALILLWLGTGAIKGFAMTLSVGIFTTMFTAVFITHLLFDLMERWCPMKELPMASFLKSKTQLDFIGTKKYAFLFSGILIAASVLAFGIRGKSAFGLDFTGGTQIEFSYKKSVPAAEVTQALAQAGFDARAIYKSAATATGSNDNLEVLCRTTSRTKIDPGKSESEYITGILQGKFPQAQFTTVRQSTLGAVIGATFAKSAMLSLLVAVAGMILYMTLRFQFPYAVASNLAVVHDVIIATGLYVLFGGEVTMNVIAAGLTILGYSINDTIVNFDRIRENLKLLRNRTYNEIINVSVNETLARTILTSFTVVLVLFMQLLFGGSGIRDFVIPMLIGSIVGTYSTIYIASPIIAVWHNPSDLKQ